MTDIKNIIAGLEFTKAMITFNPLTGEDIEPGNLNEADKITYDACVSAIVLLKKQEEEIEKLKEIIIKADSTLEIVKERLNELLYEDFRRV